MVHSTRGSVVRGGGACQLSVSTHCVTGQNQKCLAGLGQEVWDSKQPTAVGN